MSISLLVGVAVASATFTYLLTRKLSKLPPSSSSPSCSSSSLSSTSSSSSSSAHIKAALLPWFSKSPHAQTLTHDPKFIAEWDHAKLAAEFALMFPVISEKILRYMTQICPTKLPDNLSERIKYLLSYNCHGGKMTRGLMVVWIVRDLCDSRKLNFQSKVQQAMVLGWCLEILQACVLIADDVMDKGTTRRGKPCWYTLPEVQMDAVNDTLVLESCVYLLIKHTFSSEPVYVPLLELFHDVCLQTELGEMLDLVAQPQGKKTPDVLNNFQLDLYKQMVCLKTSYYSFYLPTASAMLLCGLTSPQQLQVAKTIAVELGEKFQIQDDYLDAFGDPQLTGKIGTDISDHKCTWLVVQALLRANTSQKQLLEALYGKSSPEAIAAVRQLYVDLGLVELYEVQERSSFERTARLIQDNAQLVPRCVFEGILNKIHKRNK